MPSQKTDQTRQKLPGQGKTIFVTGIAGFIGARVAEMLLEQGYKVVGIDNLNDYYDVRLKFYRLAKLFGGDKLFRKNFDTNSSKCAKDNFDIKEWLNIIPEESEIQLKSDAFTISNKSKQLFFNFGDIENQKTINVICEEYKPAAIINLAARAGVRASIIDPHVYISTNTMGCLNLLEAAETFGVKKFIQASTSSLYAGQQMPFNESLPVNEPISPYASSKKGAEAMCYTYHSLYKLDVTNLRYFTVYGPAGRPDMSVFRFINWVINEMPIILYGDGTQSRDFTYVDDIARGTIDSLRLQGYNIINLGGGNEPTTLNSLIEILEELTGKKGIVQKENFQNSDVAHTRSNNTVAETKISWKANIDLTNGLESVYDWYLENQNWVKKIVF